YPLHGDFGRGHALSGQTLQSSVQLVNGFYSCSGRVEVFYSGQWGTVCEDDWTMEDGEVVCREMGCGSLNEEKKGSFFGEGSLPVLMNKVKCVGTESSLIDCPSDKGQISCDKKGAGVICAPNVGLMDGFDSCSGRVEVFKDGQWGTVCDDSWDLSDAAVVCREVGCGDAVEVKRGSYFGRGSGGPIKMHGVNCAGSELMLSSCVSDNGAVDPSVCDISKCAGVICQSLTRLVNSDKPCFGRVEVYLAGEWGTVCDGGWDEKDGIVVCREMGCGGLIEAIKDARCDMGSGPVWVKDLECLNSESMLRYCKIKEWKLDVCGHEKDSGINCQYPVRLTGGSICSGVVEVYRGGLWGPVCYDGWDLTDAAVVCRELDCGGVSEINSAPIQIPAKMNNVNCDGSESTLMRCGWSAQTCSSNLNATVRCRSMMVVNGPSRCSGTVQILHSGSWGAVCDAGWDVKDAQVVCRELGCVEVALAVSGLLAQQSWMTNVDCQGGENSLTECNCNFGSNLCGPESHAGVICEEVTYKYRLRIEVTGDPAVDPNDPEIKDIILRKIQEKLQVDKNFTLSWKSQSNGNIFQPKKSLKSL
ncbi:putative deleted in malignant brain tumors 1 protein, partial [Triplophysa rosa]